MSEREGVPGGGRRGREWPGVMWMDVFFFLTGTCRRGDGLMNSLYTKMKEHSDVKTRKGRETKRCSKCINASDRKESGGWEWRKVHDNKQRQKTDYITHTHIRTEGESRKVRGRTQVGLDYIEALAAHSKPAGITNQSQAGQTSWNLIQELDKKKTRKVCQSDHANKCHEATTDHIDKGEKKKTN